MACQSSMAGLGASGPVLTVCFWLWLLMVNVRDDERETTVNWLATGGGWGRPVCARWEREWKGNWGKEEVGGEPED